MRLEYIEGAGLICSDCKHGYSNVYVPHSIEIVITDAPIGMAKINECYLMWTLKEGFNDISCEDKIIQIQIRMRELLSPIFKSHMDYT